MRKELNFLLACSALFVCVMHADNIIIHSGGALICHEDLSVASGKITVEDGGVLNIEDASVNAMDFQLDSGATLNATGTLSVSGFWINNSTFVQPDSLIMNNTICSNTETNLATGLGDTDGDGITDRGEGSFDVNSNLLADYMDCACSSACDFIPVDWLLVNGLPTDHSADNMDSDGDGVSNWGEYHAMTDPGDPDSVLKITSVLLDTDLDEVTVTWKSVDSRTYELLYGSSLVSLGSESSGAPSGIQGETNTTSVVVSKPVADSGFFRVKVNP